ncbi:MAG TPA: methyl-accepting chemotaxis protein, partial [Terriglobales bacterium]|nr:methyl-accepting chemotaxis protein [Terriglobales bacterium]
HQHTSMASIYEERIPAMRTAAAVETAMAGVQADCYKLLSMMDSNFPPDQVQNATQQLKSNLQSAVDRLQKAAEAPGTSAQERTSLESAVTAITAYQKAVGEMINVATVQVALGTAYMSKAQLKYDEMQVQLKNLRELEDRGSEEAYRSAESAASGATRVVLVALLLSITLSIGVSLYVGSSIVRSVEAIRAATATLSQGNLRERVQIEGSDEVAQTAMKINDFIGAVHDLVRSVEKGASEMTGASGELTQTSASLAQGSAQQSQASQNVAAAVQQMTAKAKTVSEGADRLNETSKLSLRNTEQGTTSVQQLAQEIEKVGRAFEMVNSSVGEFVKSANLIRSMTDEVKGLADQTNLLALNAAIEAAHAGEQGRGFAVVADEVRKLADRSVHAAGEIEQVTSTMARQSTEVEQSLHSGGASLTSCREHAGELQKILAAARQSVVETTGGATTIATAISEQWKVSTDVAGHIEQIAKKAAENSAASDQTRAAATRLETLAHSLHSAVAGFAT